MGIIDGEKREGLCGRDCVKMCSLYALGRVEEVVLWSQLLNNTNFIVANSSQDHGQE